MSGDKNLSRKSSAQNFKEKVVKYYEAIFQDKDPSNGNGNFWSEFFLLRANIEALQTQFTTISSHDVQSIKPNINEFFVRCVSCLSEPQSMRTVNAIQTLCGLVKGAFAQSKGSYGFDVIDLLIGFDQAESVMQKLIDCLQKILSSRESAVSLKNICLRFLLTIVTLTDNVSQNTLLEYLMINSIFDALLLILSSSTLRCNHGNDSVLLLILLVQYRKYDSTNPYIVNLSILDNDIALNGLSQIIALSLLGYNRQYREKLTQQKSTGLMSSFTSMVGSMFGSDETSKVKFKPDIPLLLALYECVHLNRNFVLALTTSHAGGNFGSTHSLTSDPADDLPPAIPRASEVPLSQTGELDQPTNLLATFIEYTSIITHDVRDDANFNVSKLCFIILNCVSEDHYANSLMHDPNINFRIPIHRVPMRHRKLSMEASPPSGPLACAVLELQVEFLISHMMKQMPAELYTLSLSAIHRLLVYQKKNRVRLSYPWKSLWAALTNLVKYILSNEAALIKVCNIFVMAQQVVNIFNMFITYGDTFLSTPGSYDDLYYDLIRRHVVYDNLYALALRYANNDEYKDHSTRLVHSLSNIRSVINHFCPKVDSWAKVNHLSSLTEEQVLEVVKTNYETLTLKLHETLDQFERYSEKPKESSFFMHMVRSLVLEVREKAVITKLEQTSLLKEFTTVPTET
ncbi:armadillo-like helical domain-containing protein 3 [Watersipora subatra]|uniref:armadillo-like helical domain-containing protein 3 n=1 Tax=Watersipora subatra TaxID=2589382 RepID=UPI00355C4CBE